MCHGCLSFLENKKIKKKKEVYRDIQLINSSKLETQ